MYTYTDLEVMSVKDVTLVASKDATKMSKDAKNYVAKNTLSYYILINTWLLLIKSIAGHAWTFIAELIRKDGLIPTIDKLQKEAKALVDGSSVNEVVRVLFAHANGNLNSSIYDELNITKDATVAVLFLLRYPKRFSPNCNDVIQRNTMLDFIATENRTKQLCRKEYSYFVVQRVRDCISNMYPWDEISNEIEHLDPGDLLFSNGVGQDSKSSLGSKLCAIAKGNHCEDFFMKPFGVNMIPIPYDKVDGKRFSKPIPVPKSYKASRIIAPEDTYRQALSKRVEYIFRSVDRALARYDNTGNLDLNASVVPAMFLEDQGVNQRLAETGSQFGSYATLDASHASDMISKVLFRSVFPSRFVSDIEPLLDEYLLIDGKLRPMQMLSTSGHSLTFRLETIVYKAIALSAAEFQDTLTGKTEAFAWAYGDDVIVNTDAAELAMQWYALLGLKINEDKSFFSREHLYRESCGKEYYKGIDMSTVAFPRFPIVGAISDSGVILNKDTHNDEYRGKLDNSLTMLISLQQKLFPYSREASTFVLDVLKAADRKLTTSLPGMPSTDPWGYIDTGRPVTPIAYRIEDYSLRDLLGRSFVEYYELKKNFLMLPDLVSVRACEKLDKLPLSQASCEELLRLYSQIAKHSCPKVVYRSKGVVDDFRIRVFELYKYQHFLQYGPSYDSELDRLLGVSSKPMSIAEFYGEKQLVMSYVIS